MSNFDFLKNFNKKLYNIGCKLEDDVLSSPEDVQNDSKLFLKVLVEDIFRLSNKKIEDHMLAFYKQTDYLYRSGKISYGYKNKLLDAYNDANKLHRSSEDILKEKELSLILNEKLFYISKKYYTDYCPDYKQVYIPTYRPPHKKTVHFENCIICGGKNSDSKSNMCVNCNHKISNASYILNLRNSFNDKFTKEDLLDYGLSESQAILLLMELTRDDLVKNYGDYYKFNGIGVNSYLEMIDDFADMSLLLNKFYLGDISGGDIKKSSCYQKGLAKNKYYREFSRLVNEKLIENFEKNLMFFDDVTSCLRRSSLNYKEIKDWYDYQMTLYQEGTFNESFIKYNELLIKEYLKLKRKSTSHANILSQLAISQKTYEFWCDEFIGEDFKNQNSELTKKLIIKEIKNNKNIFDALKTLNMTKKEFDKLYEESRLNNDEFYKSFTKNYIQKRQKLFIKNLKSNNLIRSIRKSKITHHDFWRWYMDGQKTNSQFFLQTTEILMEKYLKYRKRGFNKKDILKYLHLDKEVFELWEKQKHPLFEDFKIQNKSITSTLIKRGIIINAIKDDKSKMEAIKLAGITSEEFDEIYFTSKKEKSEFHIRFDSEYLKNRKRTFIRHLKGNDFYNALEKTEISQKEFQNFYIKDQSRFISNQDDCEIYVEITKILMGRYVEQRLQGKNKPDSARYVGLNNTIINKWLRHTELELYEEFKTNTTNMHITLITQALKLDKSKQEISDECDISLKVMSDYIDYGKSGFSQFKEIYELYENDYIPKHLEIFLKEIEDKSLNRALKDSKLTPDELNYYYRLGQSGNEKFKKFHEKYLKTKTLLYASSIIDKKSERIAFKNSNLTKEELKQNRAKIDDLILTGRMNIIIAGLHKRNANGAKLAKTVGISVDELYDWYFKGKEGDEKFKEFALYFELRVIVSRLMAFKHAMTLGVPKNQLVKKLKKDIGVKDFKIWDERGLFDMENINVIEIDEDDYDEEKIMGLVKNSEFVRCCRKNDDPETFNFLKKAFKGNTNFSNSTVHLTARGGDEVTKKQVLGK